MLQIGIRREDKNQWEGRVPIIPRDVEELVSKYGLKITVQPSKIRAFSDEEFEVAGAVVDEYLSGCDLVLAIKEIPNNLILPGKSYIFFSHTIKGQNANMPMLKDLMDKGCQLIDYEKITDSKNNRLIFFGRHAGLVGMINTLWALGRRLEKEGLMTPFSNIKQAVNYPDLIDAKEAISLVGKQIKTEGLPKQIDPVVFGFTGYGNVSRGAQEIFDRLPFYLLEPDQLLSADFPFDDCKGKICKVVFKEEDMVRPIDPSIKFELHDYFNHPEKYESQFEKYIPNLSVLVNAIYWDEQYPKLVTKDYLIEAVKNRNLKLRVIGDITCDIEGSIECNLRSTDSGNPVYVYDPVTGKAQDGVAGNGLVVLATDNLPCELGRESSEAFSSVLVNFIPKIAKADFSGTLDQSGLPDEIKRAVILWHGDLTDDFHYLKEHVAAFDNDPF